MLPSTQSTPGLGDDETGTRAIGVCLLAMKSGNQSTCGDKLKSV